MTRSRGTPWHARKHDVCEAPPYWYRDVPRDAAGMELVTKRPQCVAERHGFQETSSGLRYKDWLDAYDHSFTVIP